MTAIVVVLGLIGLVVVLAWSCLVVGGREDDEIGGCL